MASDDIDRRAELIWSTAKLRSTSILIAILASLVVWSALEHDNTKARDCDINYCKRLAPELSFPWNNLSNCTTTGSREAIESYRELPRHSKQILDRYDQDIKLAYVLPTHIPGAGEAEVDFNALSVAKIVPFVAEVFLCAMIILGFQEEYYKERLTDLLERTETDRRSVALARSEFLAGVPSSTRGRDKRPVRPYTILPEP